MSLIASVTTLDNVIMAADSGSYDNASGVKMLIGDQKIFRQAVTWGQKSGLHFLVGCAGSVRQRQVYQHMFLPPRPADTEDGNLITYMVSQYVPVLYETLSSAHAMGEDEKLEGSALIAVYGTGEANRSPHVYELLSDLQMAELTETWNATGANYEIALGALAALDQDHWLDEEPEEGLRRAMHAAERYSLFCASPFHFARLIED